MIEIIDSQIIRDGVNIGMIDGGTAYVTEKQAPRIVGQIRAAAGNPDLVVEVGIPTCKESLPVAKPGGLTLDKILKVKAMMEDDEAEQIKNAQIGVTVEVPDIEAQPETVRMPGVTTQSLDLTGFPDPKREPSKFRVCFVNHYGSDAYNAWQEANSQ